MDTRSLLHHSQRLGKICCQQITALSILPNGLKTGTAAVLFSKRHDIFLSGIKHFLFSGLKRTNCLLEEDMK